MKKVLLTFALLTGLFSQAQLSGVELGYGPMGFPPITDPSTGQTIVEPTKGGAAYLNLMFGEDDKHYGATLIIGGNSRIQYGGEQFGYGSVGLVANAELKMGIFRVGAFVGGMVLQKYEKVDDIINSTIQQQSGLRPLPELKDTNFQPYGGVKVGVGPVSVSYAPAGNTLLIGVRLFNGN